MGQEYYLAIDVGATKTLLAVFDSGGELVCECRIPTNSAYEHFKADLATNLKRLRAEFELSQICCAVPATIDFEHGVALAFGNELWKNVPIQHDLQTLVPGSKVLIHNDAKLAALSEAILLHGKYKKVLYITISTGIGGGVITNGIIDQEFENFEPGQMIVDNQQGQQWEDLASGRSLKARYGKLASEIKDDKIWYEYTKGLVAGFENLLTIIRPDAVVVGGGVGAHFEKFQPFLEHELQKIDNPMVPIPPLLKAQRPEEAVIYGCYDYIKQNI
jgi:predicted NBD/HSP70 family sugar kinase